MALRRTNPTPLASRRHDFPHSHWDLVETICAAMRATIPTAVLEAALDRWEQS